MFSSPKEDRSETEDGWQAISDLFSVVKRSMASALGASESVSDYSPGGYSVFASKTTDPEKILADIDTIAVKLNAAKQEARDLHFAFHRPGERIPSKSINFRTAVRAGAAGQGF